MELLAPTAFASRLLRLRFLTTLSTILFVLLCLPETGLGQTCDAPFCGTLDAQAATSQPQTITFNGTNLPGTGGQVVCLAGPTVNNGGSATGASNDTTFTLNVLNANAAFYQTYNSRLTLDLNWTPASGDPTTSDLELLFDSFDNQSDTPYTSATWWWQPSSRLRSRPSWKCGA
jgi:hypothetical protein